MSPATTRTKISVIGQNGRMGKWVTDLMSSEFLAQTELVDQNQRLQADAVIDFAAPQGVIDHIESALQLEHQPALIVGSTGWTAAQFRIVEEYAKVAPVLVASNFSFGVFSFLEILKTHAPLLFKMGYRVSIYEAHHVHKKDAPSGTALTIQKVLANLTDQEIKIDSLREGEIIGDHKVIFDGPGDQITLDHHAKDRSIFARGAIEAALWLAKKRPIGRVQDLSAVFQT